MCDNIENLEAALAEKDKEIKILRSKLEEEKKSRKRNSSKKASRNPSLLTQDEIGRYSRQLILPEISVDGQVALKNSKVLIVGAGGLGCPVSMYLVAAGVGTIGIVDYDTLDASNLHRQISHTENFVGENKCVSLAYSLRNFNSKVRVNKHPVLLNSKNIEDILKMYDIIVDASDNVPTRYLLNDAAVIYKKPLVSGSALKFEGQLTVYNYLDAPCYRCLFPNPPSQDMVTNCSDGGILGAVTGVIGSLQALEVVKIIVGLEPSYYKKMLLFDGLSGDFRVFKLREKKPNCEVCGTNPSVTALIDYELFCNAKANDKESTVTLLTASERVTCVEYRNIKDSGAPHVLIDVRSQNEISICCLPDSLNVPIDKLTSKTSLEVLENRLMNSNSKKHYVVCRRGNDSQKAVKTLQKHFENYEWFDIVGGLYAWHNQIDDTFPLY